MKKYLFLLAFTCCMCMASAQNKFALQLSDSALGLVDKTVTYDPTYFVLKYPNGDVPADKGVCTDVVIRAYRKIGIDLQKEVHEDMAKNFSKYPKIWGLKKPDTNIDHRRVPNLAVFFSKFGTAKSIETNPALYVPGDIVTWLLPGNLTHIGIVVNKKSADGKRFLIVHNIGGGQVVEDVLFKYTITGHYQYQK
ncbi:DUF1287 domain-containing protein [Chryseobacterium sp. OV279]|uniref:DUF1287 domain-containing protein n=1 Tax=Chryseobacterium sp. OV279 TaxID=1500285 RepID=UPI00092067CA|nr:DUF1287 domain-containing protein [Chryseobacterium sp. OV279]SHG33653.1 hypothetical protein SAMN02787100_3833 [Chryseobacterium sp. OV279]